MNSPSALDMLHHIRKSTGKADSQGLPDPVIARLLEDDAKLRVAIETAAARFERISSEFPEISHLSEAEFAASLQQPYLNFYSSKTLSPYVPLAAKGPWIISCYGAVIYDAGGYGMLGFGHDPELATKALSDAHVMANIMTPSTSQARFAKRLREKIGINQGKCPFDKFLCLNSGSEATGVATRISSARAKRFTDPGGRYAGRQIRLASLRGSFHGRTFRPALASYSSRESYRPLAMFREMDDQIVVEPNNVADLERAYAAADAAGQYIEIFFLEPVQGEGNPGMGITPGFYSAVRSLTRRHGTVLIVDSIQAGLRAHGVLSIVDYPGFEGCEPPDMEAFSKALNAGQFPLSVLALTEEIAAEYKIGSYGNTMTANPRALEVGSAVLDALDASITSNIAARGREFVDKLTQLQHKYPSIIEHVQGTGLLVSAGLSERIPVVGEQGVEMRIRRAGVNVIHGGKNALRFTPHFEINSTEIDLVVQVIEDALKEMTETK